ncbi:MAG: DUF3047 domain-containing protein [Bdellovibrionota bacterium]
MTLQRLPKSLIFALICVLFVGSGMAESMAHEVLEDFQSYPEGKAPSGEWKVRSGDPSQVYSIQKEDNNQFLRASDKGQSVQFFVKKKWSLTKYPCLQWKWRVHDFPEGADERNRSKNDSAAGIYVVFPKRWFIPDSIKYVWSTVAPVETVVRNHDRFPMKVVSTGTDAKGKWVTVERNVLEDYKTLFDRSPSSPVALGFLTDSNNVGGGAVADYDDLRATTCSDSAK